MRTGKCGDQKGKGRPQGVRHLNARPGHRLGRGLEANDGEKWGTLPGRPRDRIFTIPRPRRARPSPPPGEPVAGAPSCPRPKRPAPVRSHLRCRQSHCHTPIRPRAPSRPGHQSPVTTRHEPSRFHNRRIHLICLRSLPTFRRTTRASSHHQRWQMTATMQPDAPDPTPKRPHAPTPRLPTAQTQTDAQTQKAPDRRIRRSGAGAACGTPLPTCGTARCGRASPSAAGSARGRRP
jgi:hypothetical protein